MNECPSCGFPALRDGGHADFCWTADPSLPPLGGRTLSLVPVPLAGDGGDAAGSPAEGGLRPREPGPGGVPPEKHP